MALLSNLVFRVSCLTPCVLLYDRREVESDLICLPKVLPYISKSPAASGGPSPRAKRNASPELETGKSLRTGNLFSRVSRLRRQSALKACFVDSDGHSARCVGRPGFFSSAAASAQLH